MVGIAKLILDRSLELKHPIEGEESRPEDIWFPMYVTMDQRNMKIYYARRPTPEQWFWR